MRLLVLAAAAPLALLSSPARPCSLAPPSLDGPIAPAEGATAVPTNAKLHVELQSGPLVFTARLLQDGAEVGTLPVTRDDEVAVVDLGALAAGTAYEVELVPEGDDFAGEVGTRTIDLTTGAGPDDEAPSMSGTPVVAVRHQPGSVGLFGGGFSSCGGEGGDTNSITIDGYAAEDEAGLAAIALYLLDDNGGRTLQRFDVGADDEGMIVFQDDPGTYRYALVAVDLAGNESAPLEFEAAVSGIGCSATTTTQRSVPASLAALALLAAGCRRRRRV